MNVFISYRRSDTQDLAGRIADRLRDTPGIGKVFIDVDGIEPGTNFAKRIRSALKSSQACLVLIGNAWRGAEGQPSRLDDPEDFVRREVEVALGEGGRVLPILVNGARMPDDGALPPSVAPVAALNAMTISHLSFERDYEEIAAAVIGRRAKSRHAFRKRHPIVAGVLRGVLGLFIGAVVLLGAAVIHNAVSGGLSLEERFGGQGPVWLVGIGTLALGTLVGVLRR